MRDPQTKLNLPCANNLIQRKANKKLKKNTVVTVLSAAESFNRTAHHSLPQSPPHPHFTSHGREG